MSAEPSQQKRSLNAYGEGKLAHQAIERPQGAKL